MKILIVGGSSEHRGGVELFCRRAEQALGRRGHLVQVLPTQAAFVRRKTIRAFLQAIQAFRSYCDQDWDAIWLQYGSFFDLLFLIVARQKGRAVIVTPHVSPRWRSQANPLMRAISERLLTFASAIAILSETQAMELPLPKTRKLIRIRTFLPEFTLVPDWAQRAASQPLTLMHAGRLSEEKGSFRFLEVCRLLKKERYPFRAFLIGQADQSTQSQLERTLEGSDLSSDVVLTGPMEERQLLDFLSTGDILVHLSTADSYPLIVLEAIGCGLQPICIDLPGARKICTEYGGLIVGEESAVDEAAGLILSGKVSRSQKQREAAVARIRQDFTWAECVTLLEEAFGASNAQRALAPLAESNDGAR